MAPFRAPREAHERPRRILTDSEAQERIQQQEKTKDNDSDSEEPTEFGVVWERVHHQEAVEVHKNGSMVGDNKRDLSPVGETNDPSEASEFPSPHLADFELFLDNMTKQTKAAAPVVPNGNIEQYNEVPITARYNILC